MKIPSAKEKDFVLNLYYNRDVKGIAPPREEDYTFIIIFQKMAASYIFPVASSLSR